jgi:hypothetical protein
MSNNINIQEVVDTLKSSKTLSDAVEYFERINGTVKVQNVKDLFLSGSNFYLVVTCDTFHKFLHVSHSVGSSQYKDFDHNDMREGSDQFVFFCSGGVIGVSDQYSKPIFDYVEKDGKYDKFPLIRLTVDEYLDVLTDIDVKIPSVVYDRYDIASTLPTRKWNETVENRITVDGSTYICEPLKFDYNKIDCDGKHSDYNGKKYMIIDEEEGNRLGVFHHITDENNDDVFDSSNYSDDLLVILEDGDECLPEEMYSIIKE